MGAISDITAARSRDGQYRRFFIRYNALKNEQGRPIRWYAAGIDIEDRKQAEEKIREVNLAVRELGVHGQADGLNIDARRGFIRL